MSIFITIELRVLLFAALAASTGSYTFYFPRAMQNHEGNDRHLDTSYATLEGHTPLVFIR